MARCSHCGGHVSDRFAAVFGDAGEVAACQHCAPNAGIAPAIRDRSGDT